MSEKKIIEEKKLDEKIEKNNPSLYKLESEEILKLKNLGLQRQLAEKEIESAMLQQQIVVGQISSRVGEDVSRWQFDLQKQMVVKPPTP